MALNVVVRSSDGDEEGDLQLALGAGSGAAAAAGATLGALKQQIHARHPARPVRWIAERREGERGRGERGTVWTVWSEEGREREGAKRREEDTQKQRLVRHALELSHPSPSPPLLTSPPLLLPCGSWEGEREGRERGEGLPWCLVTAVASRRVTLSSLSVSLSLYPATPLLPAAVAAAGPWCAGGGALRLVTVDGSGLA